MAQSTTTLSARISGKDFAMSALSFEERLSEPFKLSVTFAAPRLDLDDLLGEEIVVQGGKDQKSGMPTRKFQGTIVSAEHNLGEGEVEQWTVVARPWFYLLAFVEGSEVYQGKTAVDLTKACLKGCGLNSYKLDASGKPPKHDFRVQYQESDFDFLSRTYAEDGFHWYFGDESDLDLLLLQDASRPFANKTKNKTGLSDSAMGGKDVFRLLNSREKGHAVPGNVQVSSFSVDDAAIKEGKGKPSKTPKILKRAVMAKYLPAVAEKSPDLSTAKMKRHVESMAPEASVFEGSCYHPALYLGQKIKIDPISRVDKKGDYFITALSYSISGSGDNAGDWSASFECILSSETQVPKYCPKPRMFGVHNATVVGKSKSKPANDSDGRVQVKFAWDRATAKDDSSCWIRVASHFAGKTYGIDFLPREGQEVLVSFIDGDPDAPIIIGTVHNGSNPPWIKANTTTSGIKTKLDGKENMLEFDDKKDAEKITIDAGRDCIVNVGNDSTITVKQNRVSNIGKDDKITVEGDLHTAVKGEQTEKITGDSELTAKSVAIKASKEITLTVGGSKLKISSSGVVIDAPKVELKGKSEVKASAASVKVDAKGALKMSGGASVKVSSKGKLGLDGMMAEVKGKVKADVKAPMSSVGGPGITQIKGSLVKLG